MKKIGEVLGIVFTAMRLSVSFCWRNCPKESAYRVIMAIAITVFGYLTIHANGLVINAVQKAIVECKGKEHTVQTFLTSGLLGPIMYLAIIALSVVIVGRLNWFYRGNWNQKLRYANQRELNDHRATLDVAMFRSKEYDDLQKRIQELPSSWQTRIWFADELFNLLTTIVSFLIFGTALLWVKPIYAVILIASALPTAIMEFQIVGMWWNLFQELVPINKKRHMLEQSYVRVNAFVQALMFNQMPVLRREIDISTDSVIEAYNKIRVISVKKETLSRVVFIFGLFVVIVDAVWSTVSVGGAIGSLTIVIAAARTFQGNLDSIISMIAEQWNSARGVILIEKDFLGLKAMIQTPYPVVPDPSIIPEIRFDHVNFKYPNTEKLVLTDVNFTIKPGQKVAIVGKSGHGKSTIQALLMRHYDPTEGNVFANDINLRNIRPDVWSKIASSLTQEYAVLERRIHEEIASSRLDQPIDMEAVKASAKFANFDEVVSSDSNGYESQIGTDFGGREFSGGERQRLALARVHYRGTPILILDEPDARLDPESAQKVIDQVFALEGITVIMITHHVSRAERCDHVIVMKDGSIAEQGAPSELNAQNGVYTKLVEGDKKRLSQPSEE
ncbi:MAG: ABC transporter ATP-binding protein [bacterium]